MLGIQLDSFIGSHTPACQSMPVIQIYISVESETI